MATGGHNKQGGRIFFKENNQGTYGFSLGYNGHSSNNILNWGGNSFNKN